MDDQQYIEVLGNLAEESFEGNHELISLIKKSDAKKFNHLFLLPTARQFISAVTAESDHEALSRYIDFLNIDFSLSWDKKKKILDLNSSSGPDVVIEFVLNHITEDGGITGLDIFFCKEYIHEENIKKYFINPGALNNLYKRVLKTYKPVKRRRILDYAEYECFDINVKGFIKNNDNYLAIQDIGMEKYVLNNINLIQAYLNACSANFKH